MARQIALIKFTDDDGHSHDVPEKFRLIDTDVLNQAYQDFGQWRKAGAGPKHPSASSKAVLDDRAFLRNKADIYSGADLSSSIVKRGVRAAANLRILDRGQHNFVAVSLNESATILGYCRNKDVTPAANAGCLS